MDRSKWANRPISSCWTPVPPFEAVRQGADVLASIRNGEHLFKRPDPGYGIALDLFRKTK